MSFHAFFYTNDREQDDLIVALAMSSAQQRIVSAMLEQFPLAKIDGAQYWKRCYRFLMYHAPQCYVAWQNASLWLVALPRVDEHGHFDRGTNGVHIIELTDGCIRYAWVDANSFNAPPGTETGHCDEGSADESGVRRALEALRVLDDLDEESDPADDLIEIILPDALAAVVAQPWYWHNEGTGRERQRPLHASELTCLKRNVAWTDSLHEQMAKDFPLDDGAVQS